MSAAADCELLKSFYPQLRSSIPLDAKDCCNSKDRDYPMVTCENGHITELLFNEINATGIIPPQISTLKSLEWLQLDNNTLTGTLPASLSELKNLQVIVLSRNQLTGELPAEWSAISNLRALRVTNNQLSGSIPSNWSKLTQLTDVFLQNSGITGPLPRSWSYLKIETECKQRSGGLLLDDGVSYSCCNLGSTCAIPGFGVPYYCPEVEKCAPGTYPATEATESKAQGESLSIGVIAGIVIGVVVLLILVNVLYNRYRKKSSSSDLPPHQDTFQPTETVYQQGFVAIAGVQPPTERVYQPTETVNAPTHQVAQVQFVIQAQQQAHVRHMQNEQTGQALRSHMQVAQRHRQTHQRHLQMAEHHRQIHRTHHRIALNGGRG